METTSFFSFKKSKKYIEGCEQVRAKEPIRVAFFDSKNALTNVPPADPKYQNVDFINKCCNLQYYINDHNDESIVPGYWEYQSTKCECIEKCKICDKKIGNKEIIFFGYKFLQGYLHYIVEHNIAVEKGFEEMIMKVDDMFF